MTKKILCIITSDGHIRDTKPRCRIDNYFEAQSKKLNQIKKLQIENNCPVFDCGDLLDNYRSSPFLEGWLIDNLPNQFYTIAGNHDLPNHRIEDIDKGSLGVLIKASKVKLLNWCSIGIGVWGFNYNSNFQIPKEFETRRKETKHIALVHEFISIDKFPGSITPNELVNKLQGFDYIFCGHNHTNFDVKVNNTRVINIGSMLRMDADQINYKPAFYVMYDNFEIEKIYFDIDDNVIDRKYIDDKNKTNEKLEAFITSLNGKYEISNSFKNNIDNYLKENNIAEGIKEKIYASIQ
jgi:predicted phosphodiesterase